MLSFLTILPMIVTGSMNTIFNVYTVTNKLKIPAMVLLGTGIINVGIIILLLKHTTLGIFAIPLVSAVVGILRNMVFTPLYAAKCLKVKWTTFYKAILRGTICAITMIMVCLIIKHYIIINSWLTIISVAAVTASIALSINMFIVFNKTERKKFLSMILNLIKPKGAKNG